MQGVSGIVTIRTGLNNSLVKREEISDQMASKIPVFGKKWDKEWQMKRRNRWRSSFVYNYTFSSDDAHDDN